MYTRSIERITDQRQCRFLSMSDCAADCLTDGGLCGLQVTLLKLGADLNCTNDDGWSALTVSAITGQADAMQICISKGIPVDQLAVGPNAVAGFTALMWAALYNHTGCVEALLKRQADVSLVNGDGKSAADIALEEEHDTILDLLLPALTPQLQLWIAARQGKCDAIRAALDAGADANAVDTRSAKVETQLTALLIASKEGHREAMEMLVEAGAKPVPAQEDGPQYTMLHMAAQSGELEAVQFCFRENVECPKHATDYAGCTALHHICGSWAPGKKVIIEFLVGQGAQANAKNTAGVTASESCKQRKVAEWMDKLTETSE